jgi:hypothetical protein
VRRFLREYDTLSAEIKTSIPISGLRVWTKRMTDLKNRAAVRAESYALDEMNKLIAELDSGNLNPRGAARFIYKLLPGLDDSLSNVIQQSQSKHNNCRWDLTEEGFVNPYLDRGVAR